MKNSADPDQLVHVSKTKYSCCSAFIIAHLSMKVSFCDPSSSVILLCINFLSTTSPPKPLVQIYNNFSKIFPVMPSNKRVKESIDTL